MDSLLELFCHVDDFCKAFLPHWNSYFQPVARADDAPAYA
jgi:hypothetical protein